MDYNTFLSGLARQCGSDRHQTDILARALVDVIREEAMQLNSVAIPGFGRFQSVKTLEYISTDPADGQKKLFPPSVSLNFIPGSNLKKRLNHE